MPPKNLTSEQINIFRNELFKILLPLKGLSAETFDQTAEILVLEAFGKESVQQKTMRMLHSVIVKMKTDPSVDPSEELLSLITDLFKLYGGKKINQEDKDYLEKYVNKIAKILEADRKKKAPSKLFTNLGTLIFSLIPTIAFSQGIYKIFLSQAARQEMSLNSFRIGYSFIIFNVFNSLFKNLSEYIFESSKTNLNIAKVLENYFKTLIKKDVSNESYTEFLYMMQENAPFINKQVMKEMDMIGKKGKGPHLHTETYARAKTLKELKEKYKNNELGIDYNLLKDVVIQSAVILFGFYTNALTVNRKMNNIIKILTPIIVYAVNKTVKNLAHYDQLGFFNYGSGMSHVDNINEEKVNKFIEPKAPNAEQTPEHALFNNLRKRAVYVGPSSNNILCSQATFKQKLKMMTLPVCYRTKTQQDEAFVSNNKSIIKPN
ncbi:MAG: hypothetical protein J0H68_03035 [Sphingobacteriia bacterium]|nr:hypothetical protein [Sphingobacteriia bacterium]